MVTAHRQVPAPLSALYLHINNTHMFELMNVIKKQSDELHELLNTPYGTKIFTRLEAPEQNNEAGDNVGEFPSSDSNNNSVVSIYDAINKCDVTV